MSTLLTMIVLALPAAPASPGDGATVVVTKTAPAVLQKAKAKKLAAYILRINKKTKPWAGELARAILREAKRFKLDPALLGAIAFNESWFDIRVRGRSYEYGAWQLWPWAYYLRPAWDRMRTVFRGLPSFPDKDWNQLSRKEQIRASRAPRTATFMAAWLVRMHVNRRCKKKQTARCFGYYNSGNRKPRVYYVRKLRRRSKAIRKALK
jgi:hypothetical protein